MNVVPTILIYKLFQGKKIHQLMAETPVWVKHNDSLGRGRRGQQRMRWLDGITDSMHMSLGELRGLVVDRGAWHAVIHVDVWQKPLQYCKKKM